MKKLLLSLSFVLSFTYGFAQTTIYSTNYGSTNNAAVSTITGWAASGAQSANLNLSTASVSSGYSSPITASGNANLADGANSSTAGTAIATLSGQVNTTGYTGIQISFGYRASSASYTATVTLDWSSDGSNWNSITLPTLTRDGVWRAINGTSWISLPSGAEGKSNLQFRFTFIRANTSGNFRIDDFTVQGTAAACTTPDAVTSLSATNGSSQSVVSWTNGSCFDEMMVVASSSTFTSAIPSGDGSAYAAASSSFTNGANTAFDGGVVVYKSTGTSVTVTSLTNGTTYNFKVFTRKGTNWTSGVTTSATPIAAQFFWDADGNTTTAIGGTGTWDAATTSNWRTPTSTGSLTTWSTNTTPVDAIFAGTAGVVTSTGSNTFTAPNFNFITSGYTLATGSTSTLTLSGNTVLGNNVNLILAPNVNTSTPANGTMAFGNISGSGTSSLTINAAQSTTSVVARINLATPNTSISVPISITSAGGSGLLGLAGIVATSTGTSLSSTATITNNSALKTVIGATSGNDLTLNAAISGSADLQFSAGTSGGAGTINLNAVNTYTGATFFNAANSAVIKLGVLNAIPTNSDVTMGYSASNGGILDLNGYNQTIASLTSGAGGGLIRNNGTSDATLSINGNATPAAFSLPITDGTTNKTLLSKSGTGILELTGANTYTGITTVSGGTLKLNRTGGTTIPVTNSVTINNSGTLQISSNQTLNNLSIASGGTLIIDNGVTLIVTGVLTNNGTVTNTGSLVLSSDASGTASLGNSTGGTFSNTITVQRYIAGGGLSTAAPSQRAYRFLAHPFNSAIALSQLQTAIDITGSGTGFDATTTNNPSAFSWNGASANGATGTTNNNGWSAFTSTTATNWAQYQGIRLFYRGTKGTGLSGAAYTVGSATLSITGSITTGSKTINLNYPNTGTFTNLNLVGNPYASNVQMSGITNTNTTSSYYVWNLGLGNRGGYTTVSFGSSYVLPAYAAFFVESNSGTASLTFNESNKTTSAPTNSLLRTNVADNQLILQLKSDNILWDELVLNHDTKAVSAFEYADGKKLMNPDASLYSISADGTELAIDNRNLQAGSSTALGIATGVARNFTLEVKAMGNSLQQLYLVDKYLNTTQPIEANMVYSFSTNADAASQGNARFEIVSKPIIALPTLATSFSVKVSPNPATDVIKVNFTNTEVLPTTIIIKDVLGKTIKTVNAGNVASGNLIIPVSNLSKGMYYISLTNGADIKTEKLIIQ
jgi:autotransporter-associated beta strand protein